MNIKNFRTVHLYLGSFFAPALLFFVISGAWQTLKLHESPKNGSYVAPEILRALSAVHKDQHFGAGRERARSIPFEYFVLAMSLGLMATTCLGILMALQFAKPVVVWGFLISGAMVPIFFLGVAYLQH